MKKSIITVLLVFTSTLLFGQGDTGVEFTSNDYFEALKIAKQEGKPLYIEFGVNCGYCYKMKRRSLLTRKWENSTIQIL